MWWCISELIDAVLFGCRLPGLLAIWIAGLEKLLYAEIPVRHLLGGAV